MDKTWSLLIFCFFIFTPLFVNAQNFNEFLKIPIPGRIEGKGTHFEIKDSDYLNIILESEKEIEVFLESIPRMISLNIASSTEATTTLTIRGLDPNKKYFKYEDTHKSETEFFTDENGNYSWLQDLTSLHYIWIQEEKGTISLSKPEDCTLNLGTWDETTRTCTLSRDVTTSIEIATSSITLNCDNHQIIGNGTDHGILIRNVNGIKITKCTISKFAKGIYIYNSSEVEIFENKISENSEGIVIGTSASWPSYLTTKNKIFRNRIFRNSSYGIDIIGYYSTQTKENQIFENEISENGEIGILVESSSSTEIEGNQILNNPVGIWLKDHASGSILKNNIFENGGLYITLWKEEYASILVEGNTINGKPLIYLHNASNLTFQNIGQIIISSSTDITVENSGFSSSTVGVFLINSKNCKIRNNKITNNSFYGIYLYASENNWIEGNIIEGNQPMGIFKDKGEGILLNHSSFTKILANDISQNGSNGIFLDNYSSGNEIVENKIRENESHGIKLSYSSNNKITKNEISFNKQAAIYFSTQSSENLVIENSFIKNSYGIYWWWTDKSNNYNRFYHNNFIENNSQLFISDDPDNYFDNGYPSGGNYWSNYQGKDEKWGPNRDQPGSDGIGDTPYCLGSVCDRYPFMKENGWILPKVLISEVYYNPDEKHKGEGNERDYEWVIIHNLEKNEIDLRGWQICDNEKCDKIPTSSIPSNGLAIITPTSTTFSFWRIPKNMVRIVLGNKFGSYGLANEGDGVILKDKEGKIVDAMSYGNKTSLFFPTCSKELVAKEGKSLLRDPPYKDTDTCEDFKESEPTIGKNWLPIPVINFSPKNPVKGVKVKFDASLSDDHDGEIINFEWQIGTSTSTGTTTEFTFNENGEYQITLTATDNDGATSSTSTIIKVEPFSFAIITDLHIGRHYQEEYEGQDYYLTERLKRVVKWINENKNSVKCGENTTCSIKFLAILGDITENTPLTGFCKVKEILDELQIPYVPVFGNHDVGTDREYEQFSRWKGQDYFDQVFWSTSSIPCQNATSTKNFELLLNELSFQRDETNKDYKNFSFSFGGINFIGLDFVSRKPFMKFGKGVGADAVLNEINEGWLEKKLEEFGEGPVILFAHHPLTAKWSRIYAFTSEELSELERIIKDKTVLFDFGGHIHSFEEIHGVLAPPNANLLYPSVGITNVLTTEALMVGSNGRGVEKETEENGVVNDKKGIVRIVKVFEKNEIKPNNWETTEKGDEFLALNPSLNLGFSIRRQFNNIPCVELEAHKFSEKPSDFIWDFGGETSFVDCNSDFSECLVCYKEGGEYTITLFAKNKNSNFTESISKKITVNEAIIPRTIKKPAELIEKGIEFISEKAQMSFDKIGQVVKDKIRIFKKKSPAVPVGEITVHFENLNEDLDLSGSVVDTDFEKQKTILYMENWPEVVERSKILFIPKR
jgi:parallel beta-helix repeat protein